MINFLPLTVYLIARKGPASANHLLHYIEYILYVRVCVPTVCEIPIEGRAFHRSQTIFSDIALFDFCIVELHARHIELFG